MEKSIFKEVGARYNRAVIFFLAELYSRSRKTDRSIQAVVLAVSEGGSQGYIHKSSHKRQAERLPCHDRLIDGQERNTLKGLERT